MECPVCGAQNTEGAEFCKQCGSNLRQSECPGCGAAVEPDARFCVRCGARLGRPQEPAGRTCQSCGFQNPAGTEYCKQCNQRIL